jgi:hypothetical protein
MYTNRRCASAARLWWLYNVRSNDGDARFAHLRSSCGHVSNEPFSHRAEWQEKVQHYCDCCSQVAQHQPPSEIIVMRRQCTCCSRNHTILVVVVRQPTSIDRHHIYDNHHISSKDRAPWLETSGLSATKIVFALQGQSAASKALFKAARDPSPKITHPTKNKGHYFSCLHSLTSLSISHLNHHRRCTPIAWRLSPLSLRPPGGHPYPSPPPLPLSEGHPRILPRPSLLLTSSSHRPALVPASYGLWYSSLVATLDPAVELAGVSRYWWMLFNEMDLENMIW